MFPGQKQCVHREKKSAATDLFPRVRSIQSSSSKCPVGLHIDARPFQHLHILMKKQAAVRGTYRMRKIIVLVQPFGSMYSPIYRDEAVASVAGVGEARRFERGRVGVHLIYYLALLPSLFLQLSQCRLFHRLSVIHPWTPKGFGAGSAPRLDQGGAEGKERDATPSRNDPLARVTQATDEEHLEPASRAVGLSVVSTTAPGSPSGQMGVCERDIERYLERYKER